MLLFKAPFGIFLLSDKVTATSKAPDCNVVVCYVDFDGVNEAAAFISQMA